MTDKYTVPRSDLRLEFFRAGGKGGQKQNKTSSACRITHEPSGAIGESRDERMQSQNRAIALHRLVDSPRFMAWVRVHMAVREQGFRDVEAKVDASMREGNLHVELGVDARPGDLTP